TTTRLAFGLTPKWIRPELSMYSWRSCLLEFRSVLRLLHPMRRPPLVVVVLNQASIVKTSGGCPSLTVAAIPPLAPENRAAVSSSPTIAPGAPSVAPAKVLSGLKPTVSEIVEPELSPIRQ